jgi:hypothetical protein
VWLRRRGAGGDSRPDIDDEPVTLIRRVELAVARPCTVITKSERASETLRSRTHEIFGTR